MKRELEILAPGGSLLGIKATINAGADAVYTGGKMFGAREYADNLTLEEMKEAIEFAHIREKKIYLTVNTLLKEREIAQELYDYLLPFYNMGIDAVIVQDFGVLNFINTNFPGLPIHASTQMTVMGPDTSMWLKERGVTRIVTPREMSLKEIKEIYQTTGLEIESFVHGALCYCYSGQCFMSSYIGGRSGNRGKCAQPCRLAYDVIKGDRLLTDKNNRYVLSTKDICTLELIPELAESGVYSLKIEGRMKKPEYAAGITALYRKYVDFYLETSRTDYSVSRSDYKKALDLFNRNGFSQSYFKKYNGKDMISLSKPAFREENKALTDNIRELYIDKDSKVKISLELIFKKSQKLYLKLTAGKISSTVEGPSPELAKNKPIDRLALEKQMSKMGDTPFEISSISIDMDQGLFMPLGVLNEIRRKAVEELITEILRADDLKMLEMHSKNTAYDNKSCEDTAYDNIENIENIETFANPLEYQGVSVLVTNADQFYAVCKKNEVKAIYIEASSFSPDIVNKLKDNLIPDCKFFLAMPRVFRSKDKEIFGKTWQGKLKEFDGFLVRNMEEYFYLKDICRHKLINFDYNVYTFNSFAKRTLKQLESKATFTVPVELNEKELKDRDCLRDEIIVYGYMPSMTSANCLNKTCDKCHSKDTILELKDRAGSLSKVSCVCSYCYNVIYNNKPVSLLKFRKQLKTLGVDKFRLEFTFENKEETRKITDLFIDSFIKELDKEDFTDSTRGHFNKGVK